MNLEKQLEELGLSPKEASLYVAALALGRATISDISKKSGVNRATAYLILDALRDKGLITTTVQKKKKLYIPTEPESLRGILERKNAVLEQILPRLKGLSNLPSHKPLISFYEGEGGIVKVYLDNLTAKDEILSIAGEKTFNELILKSVPDYIEQRIKNKIHLKIIAPNTRTMEEWKQRDVQDLRKLKLVAQEKFPFRVNIDVYNNKVAITSLEKNIGLIIEDDAIAETLRLFFNLTWEMIG